MRQDLFGEELRLLENILIRHAGVREVDAEVVLSHDFIPLLQPFEHFRWCERQIRINIFLQRLVDAAGFQRRRPQPRSSHMPEFS